MPPLMAFRWGFSWSGQSAFDKLLREGTQVGSTALPLTDVRTGARKSIIDGTDVLADTPDLRLVNGILVPSSLKGDTNKVTTVLTDWTDAGSVTTSEPSPYIYRVTSTGSGSVVDSFASASNNSYSRMEARLVSGTIPSGSRVTFRLAGTTKGTTFDLTTLTTGWRFAVDATVTSADATDELAIEIGAGSCVIEFRHVRAVDSTAPAAPFPDGSAAATAYAADFLSCSPTYANKGTIVVALESYYWSSWANHPEDGSSRIFDHAGFKWSVIGNGATSTIFRATSGEDVVINKSPVAGQISVISFDWDETTKTAGARFDDSGRQTFTYTSKPAGVMYPGNNQNANRPFHGVTVIPIYDRVLPDVDFETLRSGYPSKLGGLALP